MLGDTKQMGSLADKVAIITGSGRGIGRAIAEAMMNEGAKVVISDINEQLCADTAKELAGKGEAIGVPCNVTNTESVEKMVDEVVKKWGRVDILVNNAGITRDDLFI